MQDLPEEFLVGCFVRDLRDAIKYGIIAKNPTSMMKVMRLARVEEERLPNLRRGAKVAFPKGGGPDSSFGPTPISKGMHQEAARV